MAATFGRGAMTNGWTDVANADVILVMGGNPAENHPVGFRFVMEAKRKRKAKIVCVDPRFTRTAAVSDCYVPIRSGTDIAFLGGIINYSLSKGLYQAEYVRQHTNASFLLHKDFGFDAGHFSGWDEAKKSYDKTTWQYELDGAGFAKVDTTLEHPQSVFQQMKKHYSRYTPEKVAEILSRSFIVYVPSYTPASVSSRGTVLVAPLIRTRAVPPGLPYRVNSRSLPGISCCAGSTSKPSIFGTATEDCASAALEKNDIGKNAANANSAAINLLVKFMMVS